MRWSVVLTGSAEDAVQSRYVQYRDSSNVDITLNNAVVTSPRATYIERGSVQSCFTFHSRPSTRPHIVLYLWRLCVAQSSLLAQERLVVQRDGYGARAQHHSQPAGQSINRPSPAFAAPPQPSISTPLLSTSITDCLNVMLYCAARAVCCLCLGCCIL